MLCNPKWISFHILGYSLFRGIFKVLIDESCLFRSSQLTKYPFNVFCHYCFYLSYLIGSLP